MEVTSFWDREEDQPTESQVGDFIATIRKEVERAQQDIPVIVECQGNKHNFNLQIRFCFSETTTTWKLQK